MVRVTRGGGAAAAVARLGIQLLLLLPCTVLAAASTSHGKSYTTLYDIIQVFLFT